MTQPAPPGRYGERDLRLPAWGPYSKRYAGISHVADAARGTRFDLTIAAGFFRGDLVIPDGLRPSRFHPWDAAAGLSHYTYRYELEWKDRLYCDVSFTARGEQARLISCRWVNATDHAQRLALHAVSSLDHARIASHGEPLRTVGLRARPGAVWIDALDYIAIDLPGGRPDRGLAPDGLLLGEERAHGAVDGSVLTALGGPAGGAVTYALEVSAPRRALTLRLRYRLPVGARGHLTLAGAATGSLRCLGDGRMRTVDLELGQLVPGTHRLTLRAPRDQLGELDGPGELDGLGGLEIDGLLIGEREQIEAAQFVPDSLETALEVTQVPGGRLLSSPVLPQVYGVAWAGGELGATEFVGEDLDMLLRGAKYDRHGLLHPSGVGEATDERVTRFTDLLSPPLTVPAHSRRTVHGLICDGSPQQVTAQLASFSDAPDEQLTAQLEEGRRHVVEVRSRGALSVSTTQQAGQRRLAATALTNVVYPLYSRRRHIRHLAPGRWWDSLYTWDSGMIGLGLLEVDPVRAEDCLESYLTAEDDPHSAFIHHGTTVPTQQYLAAELHERTGDPDRFTRWYPGLRGQYRFLTGSHPDSHTRMPSGLLNPFAYFYNSGGWDDYPAQVTTHQRGLSGATAPMVTTSHALRVAKLLLLATEDESGYAEDITGLSSALQRCWDPRTGYFGYATHDGHGELTGLLRDEDGVNLNQGIDGVYPLIAGACTPAQTEVLLERLFSPERLWTRIGISTVDRSAPYFDPDGYWNGQVWIAHQWFLARTMLDLGRPDLARRLAEAVLTTWAEESERTYHSWESFSIATGRGTGWHQFSGLSTPVLSLFATYHRPGALTTGFDTRIVQAQYEADTNRLSAELLSLPSSTGSASAVAVLAPGHRYEVLLDGHPVPVDHPDGIEAPEGGVVHVTWAEHGAEQDPLALTRRTLQIRPLSGGRPPGRPRPPT